MSFYWDAHPNVHGNWTSTFEVIKVKCSHVATCLIFKLKQWFPNMY